MTASNGVNSIEIDCSTGLLTATIGNNEGVTCDVPRKGGRIAALIADLVHEVKMLPTTGAKDNCDHCVGACCTGWQVHLDFSDVKQLCQGLGQTQGYVLMHVVDKAYNISGDGRDFQMRMVEDKRYEAGRRCSMLDVKVNKDGNPVGRCSVYDFRPKTCREYPAHNCDRFIPSSNLVKNLSQPRVDKASTKKVGRR